MATKAQYKSERTADFPAAPDFPTPSPTPKEAARNHMLRVLDEAVDALDKAGSWTVSVDALLRILADHERVRLTGGMEQGTGVSAPPENEDTVKSIGNSSSPDSCPECGRYRKWLACTNPWHLTPDDPFVPMDGFTGSRADDMYHSDARDAEVAQLRGEIKLLEWKLAVRDKYVVGGGQVRWPDELYDGVAAWAGMDKRPEIPK